MSETSPLYTLHPEAPGTEPAGFDSAADAALQQIDADEVLAYLRKRRGNAFLVAAVALLEERYATIHVLTRRVKKAEARVKEQQLELAEQEVEKLKLITGIYTAINCATL